MKIGSIRKYGINNNKYINTTKYKNFTANESAICNENVYLGLAIASLKNKNIENELKSMRLI